jgi:hypothetical protein
MLELFTDEEATIEEATEELTADDEAGFDEEIAALELEPAAGVQTSKSHSE